MIEWLGGIAAWISQGINCVFLSGSPDMTVSSRCHINRNKPRWRTARAVINKIFFWQEDHCKASFRSDVGFAMTIITKNS